MELTESSIVEAVDHQTSAEVEGEKVILDLDGGMYYGLNSVGADVWKRIQRPNSVGDIVDEISEEYNVGRGECFNDVVSLLQDLAENNLIVVKER